MAETTTTATRDLRDQARVLDAQATVADLTTVAEWRPGESNSTRAQPAPPGTPQAAGEPFRDARGFTAEEYEMAASELLDEDEPELAEKARARAEGVRKAEKESKAAAFDRTWKEIASGEQSKAPELRDPASPLGGLVQEVLREIPQLREVEAGYRYAAQLAQARLQAETLPMLQKEAATLRQENQRLSRLTSIAGSPPPSPAPTQEAELSERDLLRLAREFDMEGVV